MGETNSSSKQDEPPSRSRGEILEPCPFGPPPEHLPPVVKEVRGAEGTYWWAGCEIHLSPNRPPRGCGVGHSALTRAEAIRKWNTRVPVASTAPSMDAGLLSALILIELNDPSCQCEHENENCCAIVGEFCARCWAHVAVRRNRALHPKEEGTPQRAATEIVKAWLWHTPEHDQERARQDIEQIISRHFPPAPPVSDCGGDDERGE